MVEDPVQEVGIVRDDRSLTIGKISEALSKAQGEMKAAHFDKENPHFKSRYATLSSIVDAIREPLSKNGLSYTQGIRKDFEGWTLTTLLMHSSGQWISNIVPLIISKNDMQGLGSAITYARRFGLSSMVSAVAEEDDDGNASVKTSVPLPPPQQIKPKPYVPISRDPNRKPDNIPF